MSGQLRLDGIAPTRGSAGLLLQAITPLAFSIPLLMAGRRLQRLSSYLGMILALTLTTWVVVVNIESKNGLGNWSGEGRNIAIWGIMYTVGVIAGLWTLLPGKWGWGVGVALLGVDAGVAVALAVLALGTNLTIQSETGAFILIGVSGAVFCAAAIALMCARLKWIALAASSSVVGAFLVAAGIDLLVNLDRGCSLAFRKVFDHNVNHRLSDAIYEPPVSTRVLFGGSWALAVLGCACQAWTWRHLNSREPTHDDAFFIDRTDHHEETPADTSHPPAYTNYHDRPTSSLYSHDLANRAHVQSLDGFVSRDYAYAGSNVLGARMSRPLPPQPDGYPASTHHKDASRHRSYMSDADTSIVMSPTLALEHYYGGERNFVPRHSTQPLYSPSAPSLTLAPEPQGYFYPEQPPDDQQQNAMTSPYPPADFQRRPDSNVATDISGHTAALDAYYGGRRDRDSLEPVSQGYSLHPDVSSSQPMQYAPQHQQYQHQPYIPSSSSPSHQPLQSVPYHDPSHNYNDYHDHTPSETVLSGPTAALDDYYGGRRNTATRPLP